MEGYTPDNPSPSPEKEDLERRGSKKPKKESFTDILSKGLESANKGEAAQKIAESQGIWEKLTPKSEKQTAANNADKADKAESAKAEALKDAIEIPLDEPTRESAIEYIDLRGGTITEAQQQVNPETSEASELAADATLLVHARDNVVDAPAGSSFTEAIDTAYGQTAESLAASRRERVADPDQPEIMPDSLALEPPLQAQLNQYEAAPSNAAAIPEATVTSEAPMQPWYYNSDGTRRFYPGTWPPQPNRSPLEKVTDDIKADRKQEKTKHELKHEQTKQTEAIQQYIDIKEQAIREQAAKTFNEPAYETSASYKSSPTEKFMWTPAPKAAEAAPQTAKSEIAAGQAAERVQRLEHSELLSLSEKVIIDGVSLRTIYEAKQITEPGLRRITHEYLKGGDIKKVLQQELLLKEMSYERDPQIRDRLAASYANLDAAAPQTASEAMAILQAQAPPPSNNKVYSQPLASGTQQNFVSGQQILVGVWVAFVVLLAIIATILLIR